MHIRRKRKRQFIQSDKAFSVSEIQARVDQEQVEAQIIEEIPRPKKRLLTCSSCWQQGYTRISCPKKE